jgi:diaminopimelate epimerase
MRFTKMHGAGNDYVYVDCFKEPFPADPASLARRVSDRHFGVGGDGLILICPSDKADARMRMYNADGSEAEMCGNGVRCVAKYAYDHRLAAGDAADRNRNGVLGLTWNARERSAACGRHGRADLSRRVPTTLPGTRPMPAVPPQRRPDLGDRRFLRTACRW